jgi:hypothetical protein
MAPTSILRNGLTSPVRAVMQTRPRSVLKRPAALPMSPNAPSFSSLTSPRLKSPHVHFPPSAVLAATYATHSPRSYDRTGIAVSPNPLTLPTWGDRVYSPSVDGFKLGAAPKPFRSLTYQASPVVADFEDPRSPKAQDASKATAVRFAAFPVTPVSRPRQDLSQALDQYPRSPYPSAPLSQDTNAPEAERQFGRDWPQDKKSAQAAELARSRSLIQNGRNKRGLTLGARKAGGNFISLSSPLAQSFVSPVTESALKRSHKPAPLNLAGTPESEKLSKDFWSSMSIHEPDSAAESEAMFTAREYPESAVLYEATQEAQLESAAAPEVLYAGVDGVPLWSPGLPRPGGAAEKIRESLLSPAVKRTSFAGIARKEITAPTPNDPFAAFPSFTAVLEGGLEGSISYPAPVVSRG